MLLYETVHLPIGDVKRFHASIISPTLLAVPEKTQPEEGIACTTCPNGSWNLIEDHLSCYCAVRRYVSWLPKQKPMFLCDDREAALKEEDAARSDVAQAA